MAKRAVVPEDLLRIRLVGNVEISPDGRLVVYEELWQDPERNEKRSRIRGVRPGSPPWDLTTGERDQMPRISPDGTRLGFLRKGKERPQIWILPLAGGEAWQLTRLKDGVSGFCWSPDGLRLCFTAPIGERGPLEEDAPGEKDPFRKYTQDVKVITELAHKLDGEGHLRERDCLFVVDALPEAVPAQRTKPPYRVEDPRFTRDGTGILFLSRMEDDYDHNFDPRLYVIPTAGGDARAVTPAGCGPHAAWGDRVAYGWNDPGAMGYDDMRLFVCSLDGDSRRELSPEFDRSLGDHTVCDVPAPASGGLCWSGDGSGVYALVSDEGTAQLCRFAVATGRVEWLTKGQHVVYGFAVSADGRRIALTIANPTDPGNVYLLEHGDLSRLTNVNGDFFAECAVSPPEFFRARTGEEHQVDTWVIPPLGLAKGQRVPTVLMIHGGPMSMYSHTYFFEFQLLAASGMGVVYTNPRGSQGYGEAFCSAIREEWGNLDLKDIYAGLDAAIERCPWMDPDRVGVGGGSYGGYMTNWIVGHTDRFKAAVTGRSVADWTAMAGTGDVGWSWMQRAGGVPPWRDASWYRQQSPITYVDNIVTPLLIEHQEGDLRCPLEQGMLLYTAVKWLGKAPVRFIRYPGEFHGMNRSGQPWHRVHRLRELRDWYVRYLKP